MQSRYHSRAKNHLCRSSDEAGDHVLGTRSALVNSRLLRAQFRLTVADHQKKVVVLSAANGNRVLLPACSERRQPAWLLDSRRTTLT